MRNTQTRTHMKVFCFDKLYRPCVRVCLCVLCENDRQPSRQQNVKQQLYRKIARLFWPDIGELSERAHMLANSSTCWAHNKHIHM